MKLLDAVSANGAGASTKGFGRKATVIAWGTFGGGTVAIQVSSDGTNWADHTTFTAAGAADVDISAAAYVRGNLTGATAPSLTLEII